MFRKADITVGDLATGGGLKPPEGGNVPIKRCRLPNGEMGWKWGDQGKCYPSRAAAARQAAAAHASGYTGKAELNHEELAKNLAESLLAASLGVSTQNR